MTFIKGNKIGLGRIPWNKGKKSYVNTGSFKKGQISWNTGKLFLAIKGEKNHWWKGDKIGYGGLHIWLRKTFGKANKCEMCGITEAPKRKIKFFQWAKLHNCEYERKRENFWMLCCPCHRKYDGYKQPWNKGLKFAYKSRPNAIGREVWNKGLKMKELIKT